MNLILKQFGFASLFFIAIVSFHMSAKVTGDLVSENSTNKSFLQFEVADDSNEIEVVEEKVASLEVDSNRI